MAATLGAGSLPDGEEATSGSGIGGMSSSSIATADEEGTAFGVAPMVDVVVSVGTGVAALAEASLAALRRAFLLSFGSLTGGAVATAVAAGSTVLLPRLPPVRVATNKPIPTSSSAAKSNGQLLLIKAPIEGLGASGAVVVVAGAPMGRGAWTCPISLLGGVVALAGVAAAPATGVVDPVEVCGGALIGSGAGTLVG